MAEAADHCAELVRIADRDRYVASLFAPAEHRGGLYALYAFNSEMARVRDVAREPLPGEIRLQWWSEVLRGERGGEARANPVAAALLSSVAQYRLQPDKLIDLIEARRFDLYDEPITTLAELESYASKTSATLFALAAQMLCGTGCEFIAEPAGQAYAMVGVLRALPLHAARRQLYLPLEVLERHAIKAADIYAGRTSLGLNAAAADLRQLARRYLAAVRGGLTALPHDALPAFLPLALAGPALDGLDRSDALAPAELAPWRRQWLIWRAAHNPARIAR
jgi:phytoene synthase